MVQIICGPWPFSFFLCLWNIILHFHCCWCYEIHMAKLHCNQWILQKCPDPILLNTCESSLRGTVIIMVYSTPSFATTDNTIPFKFTTQCTQYNNINVNLWQFEEPLLSSHSHTMIACEMISDGFWKKRCKICEEVILIWKLILLHRYVWNIYLY